MTDRPALAACQALARLEGLLPALERAHAVARVRASAGPWRDDDLVLITLSGRGDKDGALVAEHLGASL